jgi:hypothetical protein
VLFDVRELQDGAATGAEQFLEFDVLVIREDRIGTVETIVETPQERIDGTDVAARTAAARSSSPYFSAVTRSRKS